MHNLVVSCLAVAYLAANVYAIVKLGVFELARSRKHLLLYGVPFILWGYECFELARSRKHLILYCVPFILWGSVILLGCWLMEIMRRFDEWAA